MSDLQRSNWVAVFDWTEVCVAPVEADRWLRLEDQAFEDLAPVLLVADARRVVRSSAIDDQLHLWLQRRCARLALQSEGQGRLAEASPSR